MMKNVHLVQFFITVSLLASPLTSFAQNPFITHVRAADPSAEVWNDGQVWVYCSHDQEWATDYSSMDGYRVFSSYDMVNWTDHGEILHSRDVSWGVSGGGWMFAPDAAYKDGTYYLYFPHMAANWNWRVGVATSDRPEGPFKDSGHYIEGTDNIDPTCFVDDDGQAYLIWGGDGKGPKIARLKENMMELAETPRIIDYGSDNFGEGPYMHKRNGIYYFSWTCNTCYPDQGYYAMGDNPYGPFEYKGPLKRIPPGAQDHHSIIEYHGQWYYFYHVGNYGPNGSGYRRNVCVDYLYYNDDGTIKRVVGTTKGVDPDPIGSTPGIVVPGRIEAENFYSQSGVEIADQNGATVVTGIDDGDWFDFVLDILGSEEYTVRINATNVVVGATIHLLVDEKEAQTITVESASGVLESTLFLYGGKHTLKLVFENNASTDNLMIVDSVDLLGTIQYFTINASASVGGAIDPVGDIYVAQGDAVTFALEQDVNYKIQSILIDGAEMSAADSYTFENVSSDHTILAQFDECTGATLTPSITINGNEPIHSTTPLIYEGDDVTLAVNYEGTGTLMWIKPDGQTSASPTLKISSIRIPYEGVYTAVFVNEAGCKSALQIEVQVKIKELDVYQAEDWSRQSGVQTEGTSDIGGGDNVGWIENGDWCEYNITFEESGEYEIIARVATATNGGKILVSIDANQVAEIPISGSKSNGWQDWYTTDPVYATIEKGEHTVRLSFKGGGGYLFNINWFDMNWIDPTDVQTGQRATPESIELSAVYPNPFNSTTVVQFEIDDTYDVALNIYNTLGQSIKTLLSESRPAGHYDLRWDGRNDFNEDVGSGVYFVKLETDEQVFSRKILLVR